MGAGGDGIGASVHHASIKAVGHREGLQVRLQSQWEGQLVDQVDRRAGNDGATAEVLQTEH